MSQKEQIVPLSDYSQFASQFLLDCSLEYYVDSSLVVAFFSGVNPMKNQPQETKPQAVQSIEPQEPSIAFGSRKLSEEERNSVARTSGGHRNFQMKSKIRWWEVE